MNNKKFDNLSEENFLKNKAKRKTDREKTSVTAKRKKKQKKLHPALKWSLISLGIIASIVLLIVLFVAGYYFIVANVGTPDEKDKPDVNYVNSQGNEVERVTHDDGGKKYYTFLATATDAGGALTDVIMVANFHYDDKDPGVSILQIPRDTYVKISAGKLHFNDDGTLSEKNFSGATASSAIKINEAFYHGRLLAEDTIDELLEKANGKTLDEIKALLKEKEYLFLGADAEKILNYVNETDKAVRKQIRKEILRDFGLVYLQSLIYYDFGIPTDYLAQVNIKGFRGIVNAIDGVDLYIDQPMHYDDPFQDLHIHFNPGQHHLNGKKAEEYVRFRSYPGGDVDRLDAQKNFINAFLKKLLSFSTVTKIDDITTEVKDNLFTDISFNNMLKFANKVLLMDLKEDVKIHTLPGIGEYIGPVSYFVADKDGIIELVNAEFNVFDSPLIKEDFRVLDSSEIYRPAVVIDETEEENADGDDDGNDSSENNKADDEDTGKSEEDTDSEDKKSDNNSKEDSEENKDSDESENNDGENEVGKSDKNADDGENDTESENKDEKEDSGADSSNADKNTETGNDISDITSSNDADTNSVSSNDENYQLLIDMAA